MPVDDSGSPSQVVEDLAAHAPVPLIEEDAAGFGMTAEEFLEIGLGTEGLLNELNDPPDERGNAT
jgi:hypothetical protein